MVAIFSATASGLLVVETKPQVTMRSRCVCWPSHMAISAGSLDASKPSICKWCSGWPKAK